MKTVVLVRTIP